MKRIALVFLLVFTGVFGASVSVTAAENIIGKIPLAGSLLKEFKTNDFIKVDPAIVDQAWQQPVQKPPYRFPYTVEELEAHWPELMRGLRVPFPSAQYLETMYQRYPDLYADVKLKEASFDELSQKSLEAWHAYFRGDLKEAYQLGNHVGGMAREPAIMAEVLFGVYCTKTLTAKRHILQKAANEASEIARLMNYKANYETYPEDFLRLQLGYAYSIGRAIEDASVPRLLRSTAPFKVIDTINAMFETDPGHPLALVLQGAIDSNAIRKMGKLGSKLIAFTDAESAKENFERALKEVGDMAILRLEYANTLLYIEKDADLDQAILNLWIASNTKPTFAMEEYDRLYSMKRLKEIKAVRDSGISFKRYDKKRNKYIRSQDVNMYWFDEPPFLLEEMLPANADGEKE